MNIFKIQCDNKKCRFRTEKDFCELKEINKDEDGNCFSMILVDVSYEVVIPFPTKYFAESCKKYIQKEIGYDCEIRKKFEE